MKLEEVLPAMREGRVAVDKDGDRCRLIGEHFCQWVERLQRWCAYCAELPLDGWTLEPEPKVEWPKGSLGWACEQAGPDGSVRQKCWAANVHPMRVRVVQSSTALDWEVVL